jgi:hypothetical protein
VPANSLPCQQLKREKRISEDTLPVHEGMYKLENLFYMLYEVVSSCYADQKRTCMENKRIILYQTYTFIHMIPEWYSLKISSEAYFVVFCATAFILVPFQWVVLQCSLAVKGLNMFSLVQVYNDILGIEETIGGQWSKMK